MQFTHYVDSRNRIVFRDAEEIPFISWPDGVPCNLANLYMIKIFEKGRASTTLRQYAANISHILRFSFDKKIAFIDLDDNLFTQFIGELRNEVDPKNPNAKKRDSNTLNNIGRTSLDFLSYVGGFNLNQSFIQSSIGAERRTSTIKVESSIKGFVETTFWYHHSFDTPDPLKRRSPISKDSINQLYDSIPLVSDSSFLYRRRTALLRVLEITGARIGEVALLKVDDVEKALSMDNPLLKMETLKKRGKGNDRYVPILKQDLNELKTYIKIYRSRLIKSTLGKANDNGYLFVGEINGGPLSPRSLSNEIGLIRRAAKIEAKACAHMFRHRFITKLFVTFIKQYEYENKDDFRRALLDANVLKQKVQQFTGHSALRSLDYYIDLAFKEVSNFEKVVNNVLQRLAYEAFDDHLNRLNKELERGMSVPEYLEKLKLLKEMRDDDVERLSD